MTADGFAFVDRIGRDAFNESMDQLYLSGNESDGSVEDMGKTPAIFLCFSLQAVMDEKIGGFCLPISCANLLARNIS
ncbi:MAG: hypothetical protein CSA34_01335 [Desulfobulbus propionicus]|nr:MAG: hypothetical protein CSA34_01335 [Desulfobulbus propionicus]